MIGFGDANLWESLTTAFLMGVFTVVGALSGGGLYASLGFGVFGMLVVHMVWWVLNGYSLRQVYLPLDGDEIEEVYVEGNSR